MVTKSSSSGSQSATLTYPGGGVGDLEPSAHQRDHDAVSKESENRELSMIAINKEKLPIMVHHFLMVHHSLPPSASGYRFVNVRIL